MMTMKKTDSPLSRWSQRKILLREGKIPSEVPGDTVSDTVSDPDAELQSAQPGELTQQLDADRQEQQAALPPEDEIDTQKFADIDFDALDYDSDYTQFMAKNVPEIVKRKALRALWNSDPVFANLDGLNDYDEDFTIAAPMTKAIESAWNMGKGYMTAEEEEQKKATIEEDEAQVASAEDADGDTPEETMIDASDNEVSEGEGESTEGEAQPEDLEEKVETS